MAGSIGLKLVGMIKGMQENILAKEYFLDPSTFTGVGQVDGPQLPIQGRRDDIKGPHWACRDMK